jgi:hypothetical protein
MVSLVLGYQFAEVVVFKHGVRVGNRALITLAGGAIVLARHVKVEYASNVVKMWYDVLSKLTSRDVPLKGVDKVGLDGIGGDIGAEGQSDARTLGVVRYRLGERFREFRSGADDMDQTEFTDWPLIGPFATGWYVRELANTGMSPVGRSLNWKHGNKLQDDDRHAVEHESLSELLELMICSDQLDVSSFICAESLVRELQYHEFEFKKKVDMKKPASNAEWFLGRPRRTSGALVCPALAEWVAGRASEESAIWKEQCKAAVERALQTK